MIVFLNGEFLPEEQASISVFDRGFVYGDGLFETIRVHARQPFRWAQHFERLQRGARFLGIRIPGSPSELHQHVVTLLTANQMTDALLRINLSRGVGPRGYSPKGSETPTLVMTLHPAPAVDPGNPTRWRLATSSYRLPMGDPLADFKTSHKLLQILARAEAESLGADDVLLLNTNGEVTETSGTNLFWVHRHTVHTAPLGRGALPGITRAVVIEICPALGIPTSEQTIQPEALRTSEGVFLATSSQGIIPVSSLDGVKVAESPLIDRLSRAYWDTVAMG